MGNKSRLRCHAFSQLMGNNIAFEDNELSFLLAEKIIVVVSGVAVAHCSFAPVIIALL